MKPLALSFFIAALSPVASAHVSSAAQQAEALPAKQLVSLGDEVPYAIVDTGQDQTFGPFQGQDGHYRGQAPSYRDEGNGTVTDLITGLTWTSDPGTKMTLAEAMTGAKRCRVGGFQDWRMPTIKELYSLIDFRGVDPDPRSTDVGSQRPFLDASVFAFRYGDPEQGERIIDSQFASATRYVSTTMNGNKTVFGVNFADGRIKGYPEKSRRGEKTFFVLFVRGNQSYGKNALVDNGDSTITDASTGLTWMKEDSGDSLDWPSALAFADGMEFAGHTDWRLPTAKELQSIVDYTRSPDTTDSAALDPIFRATVIENEGGIKDWACYWSSTTHLNSRGSDSAVYIAFGRSLGWMDNPRGGGKQLLDVHGAGSQRSDPKTGDATNVPYGRGPQGDVVRIANMVRLVRGGGVVATDIAESIQGGKGAALPSERKPAPSEEGAPAGSKPRFIQRFDRNGDGEVTRDEFGGSARRFRLVDSNHDGVITAEEAETMPPPPGRGGSGIEPSPDAGANSATDPSPGAELNPGTSAPSLAAATDKQFNIILILVDDMGWTGTSVEMVPGDASTRSDFYQTPQIDRLAEEGLRFTRAYAPAALCTPTRAAILTGRTPAENRITTPGGGRGEGSEPMSTPRQRSDIPEEDVTVAEALSAAGYTTAHLGKWHIGRGEPGSHGFEVHDGPTGNQPSARADDPKEIFSLTRRAIDFMREAQAGGKPFYLHISHYAVHAPSETMQKSEALFATEPPGSHHSDVAYAGMTWDLDTSVGMLLEAVRELKLEGNTYIVFMSDNGAAGKPRKPNNAPLREGKGTLYEGGIRVPLLIRGPGIEAGTANGTPVTGCDLFPTFLSWANITPMQREGSSLVPLLTDQADVFRRTAPLLFHFPHYGSGPNQKPQSALIDGDLKLVRDWESGTHQLFDLATDSGEQHDLSSTHLTELEKMIAALDERLVAADAQLPTPNPNYDPDALQELPSRNKRNR